MLMNQHFGKIFPSLGLVKELPFAAAFAILALEKALLLE
jgi:hypothetical protein